jgi:hypothetical protein
MAEFVGAGKVPGMELWRIEKLLPTRTEFTGKLYSGDSYILLVTTQKPGSSALNWHIHFWLGAETSQDESGIAAYKSVELDDSLGGAPIQHREVQGFESELFMTYFKATGLEYLPGGIESGFNKVERDVYRTRLLQCKGKRVVRCAEKPCSNASLNTGDVFILDMGLEIFLYNGKESNKYEKAKGAEMVQKFHNERGAKGTIVYMDVEPDHPTFWASLGGQIDVTNAGEDDEKAAVSAGDIKLLAITAEGAAPVAVERNAKGHYTKDMLATSSVCILDAIDAVYVWTGKASGKELRKEGMVAAAAHLAASGRPNCPTERVVESGESAMFKSHFFQFDPVRTAPTQRAFSGDVAKTPAEKAIDAAALHAGKAQEATPVDDGSGSLECFRVEDFKLVPVEAHKYGQFYGGDSYVLKYTYLDARKRAQYIVYFWQGKGSSMDEVGASALLAKELSDAIKGAKAAQVRVVQGKEPLHFRSLFKGAMIIHAGGRASGFKNVASADSYDDDGVSLFHIKGTTPVDVLGVQVGETCAELNSMDSFVLVTPAAVYAWRGKGALPAEIASADKIAAILKDHSYGPPGSAAPARALIPVAEGGEPEEFWAFLGGKGEYAAQPPDEPMPSEPRLFQCSDRFGAFQVEEISNFTQEDLLDDDVYMLDCGTAVYLWIGSGANEAERTKAMAVAASFIKAATDGRDPDIPIVQVSSGDEPALFTQFFMAWDPEHFNKATFVDPYEAKLAAAKAAKEAAKGSAPAAKSPVALKKTGSSVVDSPPPAPAAAAPASPVVEQVPDRTAVVTGKAALAPAGGFLDPKSNSFSYEELSSGIPVGVNPAAKEQYLSDGDFTAKFGMDKAAYDALPAWKKKDKKQTLKLF